MNPTERTQAIRSVFDRTQRDFHDRSTEFILEATCSRVFMQYGWELDHGDVVDALEKQETKKEE